MMIYIYIYLKRNRGTPLINDVDAPICPEGKPGKMKKVAIPDGEKEPKMGTSTTISTYI